MLEELLSGIKDQVLGSINDNPEIPNEKLDDILKIAGEVTKNEVAKETTNSGLKTVMNLFSKSENNSQANALQGNILNSVVSQLTQKHGFGKSAATSAASVVIPMILEKITHQNSKTPSNDASPLADIFGSVISSSLGGGSKSGGILGALGGLFKK